MTFIFIIMFFCLLLICIFFKDTIEVVVVVAKEHVIVPAASLRAGVGYTPVKVSLSQQGDSWAGPELGSTWGLGWS